MSQRTCTCTTCKACLRREHNILETIRETIQGVPDTFAHLIGLQAINYDRDPIDQTRRNDQLPFGLDRTIDDWEQGIHGIQTPTGLHEILQSWADNWAEQRGDTPTSTRTPITYLQNNLTWAAENQETSGWHEYRHEIRELLARARHLTDTPDTQNAGANCLNCDIPLAHKWTKHGLQDDYAYCPKCRDQYTPTRFKLAARQMIQDAPTTKPDAEITIDIAKQIFPNVRPNTLDVWHNRARSKDPTERARSPLTPTGRNRQGKTTYRLADIAHAIETRLNRPTLQTK